MSGGARPWGFRQVAGTEAQGPPPPPAPAGVPPSGVPVSLGKGHAPLTQSPHTQQTVPLRPPPPALPPASLPAFLSSLPPQPPSPPCVCLACFGHFAPMQSHGTWSFVTGLSLSVTFSKFIHVVCSVLLPSSFPPPFLSWGHTARTSHAGRREGRGSRALSTRSVRCGRHHRRLRDGPSSLAAAVPVMRPPRAHTHAPRLRGSDPSRGLPRVGPRGICPSAPFAQRVVLEAHPRGVT